MEIQGLAHNLLLCTFHCLVSNGGCSNNQGLYTKNMSVKKFPDGCRGGQSIRTVGALKESTVLQCKELE